MKNELGARIEANSQVRVIEVVPARIRIGAVETQEVDRLGNIFWKQEVGLIDRLDVTVQGREHSE